VHAVFHRDAELDRDARRRLVPHVVQTLARGKGRRRTVSAREVAAALTVPCSDGTARSYIKEMALNTKGTKKRTVNAESTPQQMKSLQLSQRSQGW
jgi:hypothetical protein